MPLTQGAPTDRDLDFRRWESDLLSGSNRTTTLSVAAVPSSSTYLLLRRLAQQGIVKANKIVLEWSFSTDSPNFGPIQ